MRRKRGVRMHQDRAVLWHTCALLKVDERNCEVEQCVCACVNKFMCANALGRALFDDSLKPVLLQAVGVIYYGLRKYAFLKWFYIKNEDM